MTSSRSTRSVVPCDDAAKERATEALCGIWPDQFEGVETAAGLLWAQLVVEAVVGAMEVAHHG